MEYIFLKLTDYTPYHLMGYNSMQVGLNHDRGNLEL